MLENYKVITQIWQPQIHTHFAVKSFSSHSFALKIIIQTLLFQNIAKKIPSGHKCCKDGAREIWPIWHLRWMDKRMALCVISSVLLRFIWPRPQESNTFTGHSMKRRLHTTRSHAPIAVPSSIRRATDIRKHTAGKVRSQKSGALKRSSDKAWYISVWPQEGQRMLHGNIFYLCFSEKQTSLTQDWASATSTTRLKDWFLLYQIKTLCWSWKITNEISLISQLLLLDTNTIKWRENGAVCLSLKITKTNLTPPHQSFRSDLTLYSYLSIY